MISTPAEIPGTEDNTEDYFYGLNPRDDREGTQQLWFKLQLGLSIPIQDLQRHISPFMKCHKWTLPDLMLQVEKVTCVGCFQYSHGQMDMMSLADSIESVIDIPVQLRWGMISVGWSIGLFLDSDKI